MLLALDLEPFLQERAWANQQDGGQSRGSSHLTEAHRIDVRSEIVSIADVSTGNVTKAKQLRERARPRVESAVRTGEISTASAAKSANLKRPVRVRLYPLTMFCFGVELSSPTSICGITSWRGTTYLQHLRELQVEAILTASG